jgi:hypothetical protein
MIIDSQNLYSNAQALTGSAASTNLIDHGADRNLGIGEPMALVITLGVASDGTTGDETYAAQLQTDDNSSFSSAASVGGSVTIARGAAAGTKYVMAIPPDTTFEQYSRVNYTLGGTTPTVTLSAFLQPMSAIQNNVVYADAITIS